MSDVDIPKGGQALRLTLCPEMTLRDLFAAAALADLGALEEHPETIADLAYEIADAMLRVRLKAKQDSE